VLHPYDTRARKAGVAGSNPAGGTICPALGHGTGHRIESLPLFTTLVGDVALTVIRVTIDGRYRHQCYAITENTWSLVAIYGLYMDAVSELLRWRRYIDKGGTVAEWQLAHPDGIYPERSGF